MVDMHYYGNITSSDMSYKINPNQKFVRKYGLTMQPRQKNICLSQQRM